MLLLLLLIVSLFMSLEQVAVVVSNGALASPRLAYIVSFFYYYYYHENHLHKTVTTTLAHLVAGGKARCKSVHTHTRTARINHLFFALSYFNSFIKRSLELGEKGQRVSPSFIRSICFFFLSFFYTRHAGLDGTQRAKRFKHSSLTDYVLRLIVRSFIRSFIDSFVRWDYSFIHSFFFRYSFQFHRQNCA